MSKGQGLGQATPPALRGFHSPSILGTAKGRGEGPWLRPVDTGAPQTCAFSVRPLFRRPLPADCQREAAGMGLHCVLSVSAAFRQSSKWLSILKHMEARTKDQGRIRDD